MIDWQPYHIYVKYFLRFIPCVSVLIAYLLLHFSISEGLQQGAPLVCIPCVADCYFYCRQGVLTKETHQHCGYYNTVLAVGTALFGVWCALFLSNNEQFCEKDLFSLDVGYKSQVWTTEPIVEPGDWMDWGEGILRKKDLVDLICFVTCVDSRSSMQRRWWTYLKA